MALFTINIDTESMRCELMTNKQEEAIRIAMDLAMVREKAKDTGQITVLKRREIVAMFAVGVE